MQVCLPCVYRIESRRRRRKGRRETQLVTFSEKGRLRAQQVVFPEGSGTDRCHGGLKVCSVTDRLAAMVPERGRERLLLRTTY